MIEYRLAYLRLSKQHIVYRAHIPRASSTAEIRQTARQLIDDLIDQQLDLILCILSTERESQLIRFIKDLSSSTISHRLLNRTNWWFASRLGDIRHASFFPRIYTANEDRRRLLSHFSSSSMKILFNAIVRTYIRLPMSSFVFGSTSCHSQPTMHQLSKTHMFIQ
jgi:hypothetical protein